MYNKIKKDKINNKNIELMYRRLSKVVLLSVALTGTMASCQKDEILVSQELSQKSLAQETSILFFLDRRRRILQEIHFTRRV